MHFRLFEVARARERVAQVVFWRLVAGGHGRLHSFRPRFGQPCGPDEGFMGLKAIGAVLLASAVALAAFAADSATTKRKPTRVFVTKRSFLDSGTEVKTWEQHYTDYLYSPI